MPPTQNKWIGWIRSRLEGVSETAGLDAQVLLAHVLGHTRSWVLAHPELDLSSSERERLEENMERLKGGEPLPYVLGRWEFYGLEFEVSPSVLIPRPETELLVDEALSWLKSQPGRIFAADVGTGSGCIAVALAANWTDLSVMASDRSLDALQIAKRNVHDHRLEKRVQFVLADLLDYDHEPFDLVCANLPYIPSKILDELDVNRWEPRQALDGGADGLDIIRRLIDQLPDAMSPGALALLEIEAGEGLTAQRIAQEHLKFAQVDVLPDLAGLDRILKIQFR